MDDREIFLAEIKTHYAEVEKNVPSCRADDFEVCNIHRTAEAQHLRKVFLIFGDCASVICMT
jgi:hypothetical protein